LIVGEHGHYCRVAHVRHATRRCSRLPDEERRPRSNINRSGAAIITPCAIQGCRSPSSPVRRLRRNCFRTTGRPVVAAALSRGGEDILDLVRRVGRAGQSPDFGAEPGFRLAVGGSARQPGGDGRQTNPTPRSRSCWTIPRIE
jgi:hypothetical protein